MRASRENAKPSFIRRVLACLVSAALAVAFTPVVAWGGGANTVSTYYVEAGKTTHIPVDAIPVTSEDTTWTGGDAENPVWYVVNSNATIKNVTVSGNICLILADEYRLVPDTSVSYTGIIVSSGNSLTIFGQERGTGVLKVSGYGINGSGGDCGNITINGGVVESKSSGNNAAIGGGLKGSGGNITINGGTVSAISIETEGGAAIGGGKGGSGGNITITGGVVTAVGKNYSAGIGGGSAGDSGSTPSGGGGTVTITGGTVIATSQHGAGIGSGHGYNGTATSSFQTQEANATSNGKAVVFASSISDNSDAKKKQWSGVIFENVSMSVDSSSYAVTINGGSGQVYGSSVEPGVSFEVPSGSELTVPQDSTLTIAKDTTLTNNGTITNNGKIYVDGKFTDNASTPTRGAVYYPLTLNGNGGAISIGKDISPKPGDITKNYGKAGGTVALTPFANTGYKFSDWDVTNGGPLIFVLNPSGGYEFTMPSKAVNVKAQWTANQYTITFDTGGGTAIAPIKQDYGTAVTAPANPTRSGYTFAGWYSDKALTQAYVFGTMPAEDITLYAKWNYVPPSDPSYNVPAAGEGGVAVKVTVSGSTAVVAEISASALESAAGSGAESITIDLSGLPKGVTQAQLSKSSVDKLLAVVNDKGNAVESVTVNLGGAVLSLDAKALAAVAGQAKGANVTLGVKEGSADSLNSAQKKALSPFEVVQLYFTAEIKSGGAEIHDFGGGSVRVSVAFTPRASHNPARYVVLYVGENGAIERYATAWAGGMLSFTAPHFSTYAVVYVEDATQAAIQALEALPDAGKLKTSQAKEAVKKAKAALGMVASLDDGQKMLVDEALVVNAQEVVKRGNELVATADKKAVGKVKDKAFSVKAGKSKSIAFKTKVSAAGTKVTYKKSKGSKYISVTKSGKVTAKKGMKKGKTYTAKVKVTCGKAYKTVTITVRVR